MRWAEASRFNPLPFFLVDDGFFDGTVVGVVVEGFRPAGSVVGVGVVGVTGNTGPWGAGAAEPLFGEPELLFEEPEPLLFEEPTVVVGGLAVVAGDDEKSSAPPITRSTTTADTDATRA